MPPKKRPRVSHDDDNNGDSTYGTRAQQTSTCLDSLAEQVTALTAGFDKVDRVTDAPH